MKLTTRLKFWISAIVRSLRDLIPVQGWQDKDGFHRGIEPFKKIIGFVLVCFAAWSGHAATYCVGPSATGSGSGADWSNLKAWGATPVRGDTWYLETGSYAGKTFNTANSGTTLITIKKAISADHVTDTGWTSGMANQATFTDVIQFGSSYWTIDGQVGDGASVMPCDTTASHYGFSAS